MPLETDAIRGLDVNFLINPSHTGGLIGVAKNTDADSALEETFEAMPDANGKLDKSAIETWAAGSSVYLYLLYDQFGTKNLEVTLDITQAPEIYDGTNWLYEDENGNLFPPFPQAGQSYDNLDYSDLGNFSVFLRVKRELNFTTDSTLIGIGSNSGYAFRAESGDVGTAFDNFGSNLKGFVNQTQVSSRDDVYQAMNNGEFNVLAMTNADYPTPNPADFRFGYGAFQEAGGVNQKFTTLIFYSGDKESELATKINEINALYTAQSISGLVTYNAAPVEGATVDLISVDQVGGAETVAETGLTTQADGTVTASVARDGAKEYYFRVYPFNLPISGLTETLTATDATNLDLGVDLSALDTGQNRAYTIKATGGTGSGEVILIKGYTDKANGLVTVDYHPFGNDTTFEVCRLISGENASVLPRTS